MPLFPKKIIDPLNPAAPYKDNPNGAKRFIQRFDETLHENPNALVVSEDGKDIEYGGWHIVKEDGTDKYFSVMVPSGKYTVSDIKERLALKIKEFNEKAPEHLKDIESPDIIDLDNPNLYKEPKYKKGKLYLNTDTGQYERAIADGDEFVSAEQQPFSDIKDETVESIPKKDAPRVRITPQPELAEQPTGYSVFNVLTRDTLPYYDELEERLGGTKSFRETLIDSSRVVVVAEDIPTMNNDMYVLNKYIGSAYSRKNALLRKGRPVHGGWDDPVDIEEMQERINRLQRIIQEQSLPSERPTFRGITSAENLNAVLKKYVDKPEKIKGREVGFGAFTSSSNREDAARQWVSKGHYSDSVMIEFRLPQGQRVLDVNKYVYTAVGRGAGKHVGNLIPTEDEMLLPAGTRWIIQDLTMDEVKNVPRILLVPSKKGK